MVMGIPLGSPHKLVCVRDCEQCSCLSSEHDVPERRAISCGVTQYICSETDYDDPSAVADLGLVPLSLTLQGSQLPQESHATHLEVSCIPF